MTVARQLVADKVAGTLPIVMATIAVPTGDAAIVSDPEGSTVRPDA